MKPCHFWHVCTCSHKGVIQTQNQKVDFRESRILIIFAISIPKINTINKIQQIFSVFNGMSKFNVVKIDKVKMLHCNYTLILNRQNQMKQITKSCMITLLIPILNEAKSHTYPSKLSRCASSPALNMSLEQGSYSFIWRYSLHDYFF